MALLPVPDGLLMGCLGSGAISFCYINDLAMDEVCVEGSEY